MDEILSGFVFNYPASRKATLRQATNYKSLSISLWKRERKKAKDER